MVESTRYIKTRHRKKEREKTHRYLESIQEKRIKGETSQISDFSLQFPRKKQTNYDSRVGMYGWVLSCTCLSTNRILVSHQVPRTLARQPILCRGKTAYMTVYVQRCKKKGM